MGRFRLRPLQTRTGPGIWPRAERVPLCRTPGPGTVSAHQIIHQRRSAVALDGKTSISAQQFFTMLERVMPHADRPVAQRPMPWDSLPWDPTIHLALFVHRVDGLLPGMYMLLRNTDPALKATFQQAACTGNSPGPFPSSVPASLPLYLVGRRKRPTHRHTSELPPGDRGRRCVFIGNDRGVRGVPRETRTMVL